MWTGVGLNPLIRALDLFSFFCEELCRWCGAKVEKFRHPESLDAHLPVTLCRSCYRQMAGSSRKLWWLPLNHDSRGDNRVRSSSVPLLPIATAGSYEGRLQKLIRRLKYDDDRLVIKDLGPLLCAAFDLLFEAKDRLSPTDCVIVPVPLHPGREKKRGFNQAELLAVQLASERRLVVLPGALTRRRQTRPQYGLNKVDRAKNVSDAFIADTASVQGRNVIVLDDVFTSGATLRECASALRDAGSLEVVALAVAQAPLRKGRLVGA